MESFPLGLAAFIIVGVLLVIAACVALFVFWIAMIIDCAKRKFKSDTEKVVWILLLIFLGILGAGIYYFAVKREDKVVRKRK